MTGRILCAAGLVWLSGCAQDPLAEHSVYPGLSPFERPTGPLARVLEFNPETPAKQGLLYVSMRDAAIAATYSGRALARLDEPGETEQALAEVTYAIEPAQAPERDAEDSAFTPFWASDGYGLRRALNQMTAELEAATADGPAAAALREQVAPALPCIENTQDRADRVLSLSGRVLTEAGVPAVATLEQIKETAEALNRGVPAPGTTGCGLEEVERDLDEVVPNRTG